MHRVTCSLITLVLAATAAPAQQDPKARLEQSPRHGEWVKVRQGRRVVQSFLVFPEMKAAFVFYGTGPDKEADIARVHCPVYGFYGGNDARVNATIPRTTDLIKQAGKIYEPVTYEGAGHGFMRAGEAPNASQANKK